MSIRRRFEAVEILREFATRIDRMRFRDAASYVEEKDQLVRDMRTRAADAMKHDDTPETAIAAIWTGTRSIAGRDVPVVRRARRTATRTAISGPTSAAPLSLIEQVFGTAKKSA